MNRSLIRIVGVVLLMFVMGLGYQNCSKSNLSNKNQTSSSEVSLGKIINSERPPASTFTQSSAEDCSMDEMNVVREFSALASDPTQISYYCESGHIKSFRINREAGFNSPIPASIALWTEIVDLAFESNTNQNFSLDPIWQLPKLSTLWIMIGNTKITLPAQLPSQWKLRYLGLYLPKTELSTSIETFIPDKSQLEGLLITANFKNVSRLYVAPTLSSVGLFNTSLNRNVTRPELALWDLPQLRDLRLIGFQFDITQELVNSLINLQRLSVDECNLQQPLPNIVSRWQDLISLQITSSNLRGTIPGELLNLPSLKTLLLYGNSLSGTPPELPANSNIETLNLSDNNLSGGIPSSYLSSSKLKELYLRFNKFSTGATVPVYRNILNRCDLSYNCVNFTGMDMHPCNVEGNLQPNRCQSAPSPLAAPTQPTYNDSTKSISWAWSGSGTPPTYEVRVWENGPDQTFPATTAPLALPAAVPNGWHKVSVRAKRGNQTSPWSPELTFNLIREQSTPLTMTLSASFSKKKPSTGRCMAGSATGSASGAIATADLTRVVSINVISSGGNGTYVCSFRDQSGGPYNCTANHNYVFNSLSNGAWFDVTVTSAGQSIRRKLIFNNVACQ